MNATNPMQVIFEEMDRNGIRQQWLADRLGIDKSLLSKYKRGVRQPPPEIVQEAKAALRLNRLSMSTDDDIMSMNADKESADVA